GLNIMVSITLTVTVTSSTTVTTTISTAVSSGSLGSITVDSTSFVSGEAATLPNPLDIIFLLDGSGSVVIVVTDGVSGDAVAAPALEAQQKGITVYAIGVSGYDADQLEQIASNNNTLAFVDNFNLLDNLRNTLLTGVATPVFTSVTVNMPFTADLRDPGSAAFTTLSASLKTEITRVLVSVVGVQSVSIVGFQPAPANQLKVVIAVSVSEYAAVTMKQTFVTAVQTGSLGSITVVSSSAGFVEESTSEVTVTLVVQETFTADLLNVESQAFATLKTRIETQMFTVFSNVSGVSAVQVTDFSSSGLNIMVSITLTVTVTSSTTVTTTISTAVSSGSLGSIAVDSTSFVSGEAETLSAAIDEVQYMRGGTLTGKAIRYVTKYGFGRSDGARLGVPKVVIVVTDGVSGDAVAAPALEAQQKGITVYAIGVSGYDADQLEQIASNNNTLAFVDNFNLLDNLRNTLLTGVCYAATPVFTSVTVNMSFTADLRDPGSAAFTTLSASLKTEITRVLVSVVEVQSVSIVGFQPAPANQLKVVIAVSVSEYAAVTMKQTFVTAVQTGSLGSITVVSSSAGFVEESTSEVTVTLVVQETFTADLLNVESQAFATLKTRIETQMFTVFSNVSGVSAVQVTDFSSSGLNIMVSITLTVTVTSSTTVTTTISTAVSSGSLGSITVDSTSFVSGEAATLCRNPLDIIFLLDGSGSVGASNFEKVKQFTKKTISGFDIGPSSTQVGVIQYSTRIRQEFSMNSFLTKETLSAAIDEVQYMRGGTLTGKAIRYVTKYGFGRSDGARPGVPKVVIVVTDGVSGDAVAAPALEAQQKGITVYAIGVSGYDADQLEQIASNNNTLAFVDNFNLLDNLRNTLLTGVCYAATPVFTSVTVNMPFTADLRDPGSAAFTTLSASLKTEITRVLVSVVGVQSVSIVGFQPAPANQLKVVIAVSVSEYAAVTMKQTFVTAVQTGSLGSITVVSSSADFVEESTSEVTVSLVVQETFTANLLTVESQAFATLKTRIETQVGLNILVSISLTVTATSSTTVITTISTAVSSGSLGVITVDLNSFVSGEAATVCRNPLDVIFLLDGSGSVGAVNFEKVKQFATKTVNGFDIGPEGTQVGIIQYSTRTRQEFSMNSFQTKESLVSAIDNINFMAGGTMTGKAIRYVTKYGFGESDGARPGIPKIVIIVTDGLSSDDVEQPALEAQQKGITLYAIGVSGYDMDQLERIASNNKTLAVVENFNLLDSLRNTLLTGICDKTRETTVSVKVQETFTAALVNVDSTEYTTLKTRIENSMLSTLSASPGVVSISVVEVRAIELQIIVIIKITATASTVAAVTSTVSVAVATGSLGGITVDTSFFSSGEQALACGNPIDLIFLLDGSGSVGSTNFNKMKAFVKKTVKGFFIGSSNTRVAVMQYSSSQVRQEFALDAHSTLDDLLVGIEEIRYLRGGTMTGKALTRLRRQGFQQSNGARKNVPHVAVVVTDGRSSDSVGQAALETRQTGIVLYAVGVGNYDIDQLTDIASTNETLGVVDNFNLLDDIRNSLLQSVCSATAPVFASVVVQAVYSEQLRDTGSATFVSLAEEVRVNMVSTFSSVVGFQSVQVVEFRQKTSTTVTAVISISVTTYATATLTQTFNTAVSSGTIGSLIVVPGSAGIVTEETQSVFTAFVIEQSFTSALLVSTTTEYVELRKTVETSVLSTLSAVSGVLSVQVVEFKAIALNIVVTIRIEVTVTSSASVVTSVSTTVATGQIGTITVDSQTFLTGSTAFPCNNPVDIVFVVDGSGSVGRRNFEKVKGGIKKIVGDFSIALLTTRVGVVQYSHVVRQEFALDTFGNLQDLESGIQGIPYMGGGTRTGAAIEYAIQNSFTSANGARPDVGHVIVVVTDGRSYDDVSQAAQKTKQAGIVVFAVGITDGAVESQLNQIASSTDKVALVETFNLFDDLRGEFFRPMCSVSAPTYASAIVNVQYTEDLRNPSSVAFISLATQIQVSFTVTLNVVVGFQSVQVVEFQQSSSNTVKVILVIVVTAYAAQDLQTTFSVSVSSGTIGNLTVDPASAIFVEEELLPKFVGLQLKQSFTKNLLVMSSSDFYTLGARVEKALLPVLSEVQGFVSVRLIGFQTAGDDTVAVVTTVGTSSFSSNLKSNVDVAVTSGTLGDLSVETSVTVGDTGPPCDVVQDIVYVVEGSDTMGANSFARVKEWIKKAASDSLVSPNNQQVSVVQFSDSPRQEIKFGEYTNIDTLSSAIDALVLVGGGNKVGTAISFITASTFSERNGARTNAPKVAVFIIASSSEDEVLNAAMAAQTAGILMYAFSVDSLTNQTQLEDIASRKQLSRSSSLNSLDDLRNTVLKPLCYVFTVTYLQSVIKDDSNDPDTWVVGPQIVFRITSTTASVADIKTSILAASKSGILSDVDRASLNFAATPVDFGNPPYIDIILKRFSVTYTGFDTFSPAAPMDIKFDVNVGNDGTADLPSFEGIQYTFGLYLTDAVELESATTKSAKISVTLSTQAESEVQLGIRKKSSTLIRDIAAQIDFSSKAICEAYSYICVRVTFMLPYYADYQSDNEDYCTAITSIARKNCDLLPCSSQSGCSPNAVCTQDGSSPPQCKCQPGFTGDGRTCTDVNECDNSPCNENANQICRNTFGHYECNCRPGYTDEGGTCIASNKLKSAVILTKQSFSADLTNPVSTMYKQLVVTVTVTITSLFRQTIVSFAVVKVTIIGFRPGSVVADYTVDVRDTSNVTAVDLETALMGATTANNGTDLGISPNITFTANLTTARPTVGKTASLTTPSPTVVNTTANITTPRVTLAATTAHLTTPSPPEVNTTASVTTLRLTKANTTANLTTPSSTLENITPKPTMIGNTTANITTPIPTIPQTTINLTTPKARVENTTANMTTSSVSVAITIANVTANLSTVQVTPQQYTNLTTLDVTKGNITANVTSAQRTTQQYDDVSTTGSVPVSVTPLVTPVSQTGTITVTTVPVAVDTTKVIPISSEAVTTQIPQTPVFSATNLKMTKVSQSQYSEAYPATVDVSVTLQKSAGNISSDDFTEETLSAVILFTNNGNLEDATVRSSTFGVTISEYDIAFLKTYAGQRTSLTLTDLKASNVAVDNNCALYTHLCLNVTSTNENVRFGTSGDTCLQLGSGEGQAGPKNCSLAIGSCTETCDTNAVCVNQGSSSQCVCKSGYSGDGTSCTDVNECESTSAACSSDENANCVNSVGSFSCVCKTGYHEDNGTCVESDRFNVEFLYTTLNYVVELANKSSTIYVTYARNYEIETIHLYLLVGLSSDFLSISNITFRNGSLYGSHTLETKKGTTTAAQVKSKLEAVVSTTKLFTNVTAQDYDECSDESRNDCFQHSECVNTPGSYTCSCPTGFIDRNLSRPGRVCGADRFFIAVGAIGGALFLFILLLCALQGSKKPTHTSTAKMSFSAKTEQHGPIPVKWRRVDRLNKATQMSGFTSGGLVWAQDAGKTLWWPARIVSTVNGASALWVRWYGSGLYSKDAETEATHPPLPRAYKTSMHDTWGAPKYGTVDEFATPASYYPVDWRGLQMQQFSPYVMAAPNLGRDRIYLPSRDRSQTMADQSDWYPYDTLASRPPRRQFAEMPFGDQERGYGSQSSRQGQPREQLDENAFEATIDFTSFKAGSGVSQTDRASESSDEVFQDNLDMDEIYFNDDFWEQFPDGPMGQSEA
ncbi:Cartilage matrix protein, partial [Branchiostoma belcheri]